MLCPCCSGKSYAQCCQLFHEGKASPLPLELMRSRYCAYAFANSDYIIRTTHPQSPYFDPDQKKWKKAILHFCHTTQFKKLEIISAKDNWVHFVAYLRQLNDLLLEEKSYFEHVEGQWLYLKGEVSTRFTSE